MTETSAPRQTSRDPMARYSTRCHIAVRQHGVKIVSPFWAWLLVVGGQDINDIPNHFPEKGEPLDDDVNHGGIEEPPDMDQGLHNKPSANQAVFEEI